MTDEPEQTFKLIKGNFGKKEEGTPVKTAGEMFRGLAAIVGDSEAVEAAVVVFVPNEAVFVTSNVETVDSVNTLFDMGKYQIINMIMEGGEYSDSEGGPDNDDRIH
jgi:hypothetical protein